jgi:hypothetical protein
VRRLGADAGHRLASGGQHVTPDMLHKLPVPVREAFESGVTSGVHGIAIGGTVLAAIAFVVAWFIKEVPLRGSAPASKAPAEKAPEDAVPAAESA